MSAPDLDILKPTDGRGPWLEFLCRACGMIYNERDGDPDSGIAPGTRFSDIPQDWCCPICGVRKQDFEPYVRPQGHEHAAPVVRKADGGVVIIGAGIAGWAVAGEIRQRDADLPITLITQCAGDVYHKPELAVAFARGMSPGKLRREYGVDAARRLNVRLVRHCSVVGLAPRFGRVRTTRGTFRYDSLVIASGARAQMPAGLDPALCWRINHLQAWKGLHLALQGGAKRVAIIGAGMVGCELAEDLLRAGHHVDLVSVTAEPMDGFLPSPAGARVRQGLEALGVRYVRMKGVRAVSRAGSGCGQMLVHPDICADDPLCQNTPLEVDEVVCATGVSTPLRLFQAAGLVFRNGLVVDPQTLQTSAEGIYALGDCISLDGAPCRFVEPILKQATAIAAKIMGASNCAYVHRPPVIRLKLRAVPMVIEGQIYRDGEWRMVQESPERLEMEQHRDGHVTARLVA